MPWVDTFSGPHRYNAAECTSQLTWSKSKSYVLLNNLWVRWMGNLVLLVAMMCSWKANSWQQNEKVEICSINLTKTLFLPDMHSTMALVRAKWTFFHTIPWSQMIISNISGRKYMQNKYFDWQYQGWYIFFKIMEEWIKNTSTIALKLTVSNIYRNQGIVREKGDVICAQSEKEKKKPNQIHALQ